MTQEHATVKSQVSAMPSPAERLRLQFADTWGGMSAAWGVAPAIGRVHAYLLISGVSLTEREVREALGLSHRAASLALNDAVAWGIVERVSEPRRVGRRGPAGTAFVAVGDHWQWFTRVIAERTDQDVAALRDWLVAFNEFVRLFDRAVGLIPKLQPRELERGMRLLGEVSDETVLRLVHLLGGLPDDDVLELVEAISRLSPTAARRATKLMSGVVRTVAR